MGKDELIDILVSCYREDKADMKSLSKEELEELYEAYNDDSDMFPNGRDFEAEDEDGPF